MPQPTTPSLEKFFASFEPPESKELAHWVNLHEKFNYPPGQFYALIEKNLAERKMDRVKVEFAMLRERGMLSAERLYLFIRRERLNYVICAAPFGTGFMVSSRLVDLRRTANPLHYLLAALFLGSFYFEVWRNYGWVWGVVATGLLFNLSLLVLRVAATSSAQWLDENIPKVAVIGPLYESWFNPDTLYRRDQTEAFQKAVHNTVLQSVNEMTAAQGIRALTPDEERPVLRGLHKR